MLEEQNTKLATTLSLDCRKRNSKKATYVLWTITRINYDLAALNSKQNQHLPEPAFTMNHHVSF
jgi:hypothetical protein